jgi:hemolysin III
MSALTHFAGAIGAALGTILLVWLTWQETTKMISLAIYGTSMVALYTASTIFHGIKLPEGRRMWLNRLDHVAIFVVIAGTYTPIIFNLFPDDFRWISLATIWFVALGGMAYKLLSPRIHGFINASIYPLLAWAGVVPVIFLSQIKPIIPAGGVALLLIGGLIYMAGFVIYYWRRPDPWPNVFGHHEIWHLFVIGGSFFHYLFMLAYIVPLLPSGISGLVSI